MYGRHEMCLHGLGCETYGKEPLGKPRFIWQDNIKNRFSRSNMGGHELGYSCQGYRQVAYTSECCSELSGSIKLWEIMD